VPAAAAGIGASPDAARPGTEQLELIKEPPVPGRGHRQGHMPDLEFEQASPDELHAAAQEITGSSNDGEFEDESGLAELPPPRAVPYRWDAARRGGLSVDQCADGKATLTMALARRGKVAPEPVPDDEELRRVVRETMQVLYEFKDEEPEVPRELWPVVMDEIRASCLDAARFQCGRFRLHLPAWEQLFTSCHELGLQTVGVDSRGLTRSQKKVLQQLQEKPKYERRHIKDGENGRKAAVFRKKRAIVRQALVQDMKLSEHEADRMLSDAHAPDVRLPNRKSCYTPENFPEVLKGLEKAIAAGQMVEWSSLPEHITRGLDTPPRLNPLSCARRKRDGKARVCCDEMLDNLWMKDLPTRLDSIADLVAQIELMRTRGYEPVVAVSDETNCYWHSDVHDDDLLVHCFEFCGVFLVCVAQPFGSKQAGAIAVRFSEERERPMRLMGYLLSKYVDDAAKTRKSPGHSLWVDVHYFRLMTALGVYYGFGKETVGVDGLKRYEKVQLVADPQPCYIGFQANIPAGELSIPDERMARILARFAQLVEDSPDGLNMPPQACAEAGGHFASIAPAFPFARPLAGLCVLALQGLISWKQALANGAAAVYAMKFFIKHGRALNGRRYLGPVRRFTIEGDYSPQAIGGVIRDGVELMSVAIAEGDDAPPCWVSPPIEVPSGTEAPDLCRDLVVVGAHTASDQAAVDDGNMSSALGEARVAERLIDVVLEKAPAGALKGAELNYLTDASAFAFAFAKGFSPSVPLNDCLWSMQLKLAQKGATLHVAWRSRETAGGRLMDHIGKFVDNSCWVLNSRVLLEILEAHARSVDRYARIPTVDGAADDESARYKIYVSRFYCAASTDAQGQATPASSAIDFTRQGAWFASRKQPDGLPALIYFNVPFGMMSQLLTLVARHALDCVIIYPLWPRPWTAQMDALPIVGEPQRLPENRGTLFKPGRRAAPSQRASDRKWGASFIVVNYSDEQRAKIVEANRQRWA
jgi:hypothetical protein